MRVRTGRPGGLPRFTSVLRFSAVAALTLAVGAGETLAQSPGDVAVPKTPPAPSTEYAKRVVAYVHGTTPITREELGEYLIARYGAEKLELLVNKMIIERACAEKGITVTAAEVEQALAEDAKSIQIDTKMFVEQVLKNYRKTLYEWKEDVIRPRLLMNKLCADRVKVDDDDIRKAFETHYGEKVEGRLVVWPHGEEKQARNMYAKLRDSEDEFAAFATHQANPQLAASGGKIKPMGRFGADSPELEKEVFRLQAGECTALIDLPNGQGIVMFRCDRRLAPEAGKTLEAERESLTKEIYDRKLAKIIPDVFKELKAQANPTLILRAPGAGEDLHKSTEQLLEATRNIPPAPPRPGPAGNLTAPKAN